MAKKVFNVLLTVLLIVLSFLVAMMFIARLSGNSLSVFGLHFYRVASGSMEPALMQEDIIVVKKVPISDIKKGDIITYKSSQGEMRGQPITHRVITDPVKQSGIWFLQTQGDAQGTVPDPEITSDQVIGKYVLTIPLLGKLYSFFLTPAGLVTMVIAIVLLFGYEIISLLVSYRSIDKIGIELQEELDKTSKKTDEDQKDEQE